MENIMIDEDYSAVWQSSFEKQRDNSIRNEKVKVKKKKGSYKINLTSIILAGLLTVGAVKGINSIKVKDDIIEGTQIEEIEEDENIFNSISSYFTRNDKDSELNMDNLSKEIGSLVFVKNADFSEKYDTTKVSIISQCSYLTNDNKDYFYNTEQMARKILQLDDRTVREYAIASILRNMKNAGTINNEVQARGMTNGDSLIYYLEIDENVKDEDKQFTVDNFKDYLKQKKCETLEDLIELVEANAEYVSEYVKQAQIDLGIEEGVKKNA